MYKILYCGVAAVLGVTFSLAAGAAYNASASGTVTHIQQEAPSLPSSAETFVFQISNQPTGLCGPFNFFIISPASVTDAQTRKNLVAMVLMAKAMGSQITVAYDNTGASCDQQFPVVYYIQIL